MKKLTYKDAGVNIEEGERVIEEIKRMAKETYRTEVLGEIGGFGALFSINTIKYKNPVLVSSTDGVGTKLKIAFEMDKHSTIGIDLIAMGVNDIITHGAEPLFFLDYLATGRLNKIKAEEIIKGLVEGCKIAGCALIGGETAEMPGFYQDGEYDLAGFAVGVVERDRIIDGSDTRIGDSIIGLASSGLHSNGFSLARRVLFHRLGLDVESKIDGFDRKLGEELLIPTRIYVKTILNLIKDFTIKGIAHITGGGIIDNIPRILPNGCKAVIQKGSWESPFIFKFLQEQGGISVQEMYKTFNCGIGMVIVIPQEETKDILHRLDALGEKAFLIGAVDKKTDKEKKRVVFV